MIIAEIGINGGSSQELRKELVRTAKQCGAELAKFQLYSVEKLFPDRKIVAQGRDWYNDVVPTELTKEDANELYEYGREVGIEVFFSVFDYERIQWCEDIGVDRYKIAYNQSRNESLIQAVRNTGKSIVISTDFPREDMWSLYCVPEYPTPIDSIRLPVFTRFGFQGFSDHSIGLDASMVALSRGAKVIEKHFCLKRDNSNPDMICSIEPHELERLCRFEEKARRL